MDKFVQNTTGSGCTQSTTPRRSYGPNGIVMDYYDGNTVTALWNYAQHFALNDNSYDSQFGPSTPGAINLIVGRHQRSAAVHGREPELGGRRTARDDGDTEPYYDQCSNPGNALDRRRQPGGVTAR